jgi:hypothetical protein
VKSRLLLAGVIALFATNIFALTPNVPSDPDPVVAALSNSQSGAVSGSASKSAAASKSTSASTSKSNSASKSNATGGSAKSGSASTSTSGDSSAASDASSDNDTSVSSDDDVFIPRNTPPVLLPALIQSECGSGGSAGGSGTGGAGALSGLWTSKRCYALKSASIAFGAGDYEGGCKLLAYVNREAYKLVGYKPDCVAFAARLNKEAQAVVTLVGPPVETSQFVTQEQRAADKAEAVERTDRAFKGAIGK